MGKRLRLVSLSPSNTEIVAALGLTDWLVGVDDWSDWPAAVAQLPRVGPDLNIDVEKVKRLQPDLVLCSRSVPGMERCVAAVQQAGLPFITLDPHHLPDIYRDILLVGEAVGLSTPAQALVATLQERVEAARLKAEQARGAAPRPVLYWEWWPKPIFTPGGRNWLSQVSDLAGAHNLFAPVDADQARPTYAEVRDANPHSILLVWTGVRKEKVNKALVAKRPGWADMQAVRAGRVHVLEEGLYCRPSPRLIDGLEALVDLLWAVGT